MSALPNILTRCDCLCFEPASATVPKALGCGSIFLGKGIVASNDGSQKTPLLQPSTVKSYCLSKFKATCWRKDWWQSFSFQNLKSLEMKVAQANSFHDFDLMNSRMIKEISVHVGFNLIDGSTEEKCCLLPGCG